MYSQRSPSFKSALLISNTISTLIFLSNIFLFLTVLSAPQYTPDTNNGQLPEDSSSSVPSLDVSELDDYYTDNGEKQYLTYHFFFLKLEYSILGLINFF